MDARATDAARQETKNTIGITADVAFAEGHATRGTTGTVVRAEYVARSEMKFTIGIAAHAESAKEREMKSTTGMVVCVESVAKRIMFGMKGYAGRIRNMTCGRWWLISSTAM